MKYTAVGLLLAVSSAAILTLAFPPYNLGLLIWVAFVPMLLAQYWLLPGHVANLAPAIAIGGWLGVLLVPIFGGGALFALALFLAIGGLVLLVDKNKRPFHEQTGYRWFVLEGAVGWVGLEMIRGFIPAIGTWAFVGYPLWNQPWLLQPLSLFGIYGLDLLIMLFNYALALALLAQLTGSLHPAGLLGHRGAALAIVSLLVIGWIGLSLVLAMAEPEERATVRVAAIQPNLPRAAHRDPGTAAQRLAVLAAQTRAAASQGAQLIVWPEMGLGFDPQVESTAELQALAAETNAYLVIGYVLDEAAASSAGFRNEAVILTPAGRFQGVYSKKHPMIASGEPRSVNAGRYPVTETSIGRLATMICFDAHFTDVARRLGIQGAQIIANPSLFGPPIAELPYTQVVFRAIENRTAVIMADVAYNSAIVDGYGRVHQLAITPKGAQTTLIADVPWGTGNTLYARLGDWLGWLSLAGLICFFVAQSRPV
jgi:apolipoprotein N-acyltransferase